MCQWRAVTTLHIPISGPWKDASCVLIPGSDPLLLVTLAGPVNLPPDASEESRYTLAVNLWKELTDALLNAAAEKVSIIRISDPDERTREVEFHVRMKAPTNVVTDAGLVEWLYYWLAGYRPLVLSAKVHRVPAKETR